MANNQSHNELDLTADTQFVEMSSEASNGQQSRANVFNNHNQHEQSNMFEEEQSMLSLSLLPQSVNMEQFIAVQKEYRLAFQKFFRIINSAQLNPLDRNDKLRHNMINFIKQAHRVCKILPSQIKLEFTNAIRPFLAWIVDQKIFIQLEQNLKQQHRKELMEQKIQLQKKYSENIRSFEQRQIFLSQEKSELISQILKQSQQIQNLKNLFLLKENQCFQKEQQLKKSLQTKFIISLKEQYQARQEKTTKQHEDQFIKIRDKYQTQIHNLVSQIQEKNSIILELELAERNYKQLYDRQKKRFQYKNGDYQKISQKFNCLLENSKKQIRQKQKLKQKVTQLQDQIKKNGNYHRKQINDLLRQIKQAGIRQQSSDYKQEQQTKDKQKIQKRIIEQSKNIKIQEINQKQLEKTQNSNNNQSQIKVQTLRSICLSLINTLQSRKPIQQTLIKQIKYKLQQKSVSLSKQEKLQNIKIVDNQMQKIKIAVMSKSLNLQLNQRLELIKSFQHLQKAIMNLKQIEQHCQ